MSKKVCQIFKIMAFLIGLIASMMTITGISIVELVNIYDLVEKRQDMLNEKISELYDEIQILNLQLQHYTFRKEYILVNREGNKINPAKLLNYRPLIVKMEEISKDYYLMDLVRYMEECNYDVNDEYVYICIEWFFRMEYEQQAEILSRMFVEMSPYTYKVAKSYQYYADITRYEDHTVYSNIRAEAVDIEERGIQMFVCRQLRSYSFGLIRITDENKALVYHK